MERAATIYLRNDGAVFVRAQSYVKSGPIIGDGPILETSIQHSENTIGQLILDAISNCRYDLEFNKEMIKKQTSSLLLKTMGFKTSKALENATKVVDTSFRDDCTRLYPTSLIKPGRGYDLS